MINQRNETELHPEPVIREQQWKSRFAAFAGEHAAEIGAIASRGGIAVILFESQPMAEQAARAGLGWDGMNKVWMLGTAAAKRLAKADHVTKRWVERRPNGGARMLVLSGSGTLLVNFRDGRYSVEPGSSDATALS